MRRIDNEAGRIVFVDDSDWLDCILASIFSLVVLLLVYTVWFIDQDISWWLKGAFTLVALVAIPLLLKMAVSAETRRIAIDIGANQMTVTTTGFRGRSVTAVSLTQIVGIETRVSSATEGEWYENALCEKSGASYVFQQTGVLSAARTGAAEMRTALGPAAEDLPITELRKRQTVYGRT